jgi:hypothetical protein
MISSRTKPPEMILFILAIGVDYDLYTPDKVLISNIFWD